MARGSKMTLGAAAARVVALAWAVLAACTGDREPDLQRLARLPAPAELVGAEALFGASCAGCHGEKGVGTSQGPPLVHPVYRPSHHGDAAFVIAVMRGVKAHHWHQGDMPPVPGLAAEQVGEITRYVRWLQREAGVR